MNFPKIINNFNDIVEFSNNVSLNSSINEFAFDLEGDNLCRHGKINYIQLFVIQTNNAYIFNCSSLNKNDIKSALGSIFENKTIAKYMFDCRSDADALYHQYEIRLNGVVDVQLYEVGYRKCSGLGGKRSGFCLLRTLSNYSHQLNIPSSQLAIKDRYSMQFKQKNFQLNLNEPDVVTYLTIDIIYLKKLFLIFCPKIDNSNVKTRIERETESRQNIWMKSQFVNDRSNAISAI